MSSTLKLWDTTRLAGREHAVLVEIPPEEPFDRLARIAAGLLQAPIALVTLLDGRRHFIEGLAGVEEPWSCLEGLSFGYVLCRDVVEAGEAVVIGDACESERAHGDAHVPAYAGVPLRTANGEIVGSFCVMDRRTREWTAEDLGHLRDLAACSVAQRDRSAR